jgi:hypothetical protein
MMTLVFGSVLASVFVLSRANADIESVDSITIDSASFSRGGFLSDPSLTVKSGGDTIEIVCRGYDNSVQIFPSNDEQKRIPLEISKDQCAKQLAMAADSAGHTLIIERHKTITIK